MTLPEAWRVRLGSHHALWSSPLLMPGAILEKPLDELAVPLDVAGVGRGPVPLAGGLVYGRRTVLVGPAGSGKTTALQLLFRELIGREDSLPLMLDVRALEASVDIDSWVQRELEVRVPEARNDPGGLASLGRGGGPRPLLLLDGWDELGDGAVQVRERLLGLCRAWPALDVVLASRPAARALPTVGDGFQQLALQPLDAERLAVLVGRLIDLTLVPEVQDQARTRFLSLVAANPSVQQLARRPLLLQILVWLGDVEALPARRDELYRDCVTTLLFARTLERDPTQALDRLGALAWAMQRGGRWSNVVATAFPDLPAHERSRFVAWVASTTGLIEAAQGGFRFQHPALREYLAAHHISGTTPANRRAARVRELAAKPRHWEVLRLWLSMLQADEPSQTDELLGQVESVPLRVMLLADGVGPDEEIDAAARSVRELLATSWPPRMSACATALASSPEPGRVRAFGDRLVQGVEVLGWPAWLRVRELVQDGDLGVELPPPERPEARMVLDAIGGRVELQGELAVGRMLSAGSPLWPGVPWQAALLWAWPSQRPMRARWLQRLAGLGWGVDALRSAPAPGRATEEQRAFWLARVRGEWTGRLDDHGTYAAAEHWAHVVARTDAMAPPALGRRAVLELLAETTTPPQRGGAVALLRAACLQALGRPSELSGLLSRRYAEPLWPALARAVAGRATEADRGLMTALAHDPAQRSGGLGQGLRYIVRGDVWTVDGVVTLAQLGVELPVLSAAAELE